MTDKDGEPKRGRNCRQARAGVPGAITLAGSIMALVAHAMLFDDGDSEATGEAADAAALPDGGDLKDPES